MGGRAAKARAGETATQRLASGNVAQRLRLPRPSFRATVGTTGYSKYSSLCFELGAASDREMPKQCKTKVVDVAPTIRERMKKAFYEIYKAVLDCRDETGWKPCQLLREVPDKWLIIHAA